MRTSTCVLLLGLCFGLTTSITEAKALDFSSVSIDPSDIQQFEQSYENWVQGLIQNIVPAQKPTVLVDMTYTQSPERLQTYSELKATQHLPGLPEVMDPHIGHPTESPVSALLQSRKIKIIFEKSITAAQEKVLAEVLNTKLRINAAVGDQLVVSTMDATPEPEQNRIKDPKVILAIVMASLALAAILAQTRKQKRQARETDLQEKTAAVEVAVAAEVKRVITPPPPPVKPFQFNDQDRAIINRLMQANSGLVSKTSSIVSPTQIILKSEPKAVIRVIRSEAPAIIAQAIHGSSILFQKTILSICTSKQRLQIRELAKTERFRKEQTLFAQNLIAAKIYRELQNLALQSVDTFVQARETLKHEKATLIQIRELMTRVAQAPAEPTQVSPQNREVPL